MKPKTNRKLTGMDLCQTPAYALDPLLPYLKKGWIIWECACGEGLLAKALFAKGFAIVATDIIDNHDFFAGIISSYDAIVTNPPYSIKYEWSERCYKLKKPFALLMPVEMLGAKKAQDLFVKHGIEIILMDKRVNFKMPNKGWDGSGAQFPVAWYTWGLGIGRQLTFTHLERR